MKIILSIVITIALVVTAASSQEVLVEMRQQQGYIGIPLRLAVIYKNISTDNEPTVSL